MLPFALAAAAGAYFLLERFGVGADWAAILGAVAGGWTLGRLMRR